MRLLQDDQIDESIWSEFLNKNKHASPFQSPEYYKLFSEAEGFDANVIAVESERKLRALVLVSIQKEPGPKAAFSKRGIIYGGPILTDQESAGILFDALNQFYRKKLIYLETRNFSNYTDYKEVFTSYNWEYQPWLNYQLICDDASAIKKRMSSSRFRQVKKALKNGAQWRESNSLSELTSFYSILEKLYREKIRKPLLPLSFFEELMRRDLAKFLFVYAEDKVVGGIVCPIQTNRKIFEFYVCGLDSEYRDMYPSVLATYAAIEYGLENDLGIFDFMGAGSPDEAYGVREFKARFGGEEVEEGRFIRVLDPVMFKIGKVGLKILAFVKR